MKPSVYVTRRLPETVLEPLREACHVEIWDQGSPPPYDAIVEGVGDKQGLFCLVTDRIDAGLMDAAPELTVISLCAVGYDNIDVEAATVRGIPVGNTPGVLTDATADFAFALLMSAARRIGEAIDYVRAGHWQTWDWSLLLGQSVRGATLGIVGMGRIGQAMAQRANGFAMRVLYYDPMRQPQAEAELGVEYCALEDLLRESDYVSLHVSLTKETQGLMNAQTFALMKPTAVLLNTSRGPVVDSDALYEALKECQIGYAALDVTDPEPLPADHKLLELPNLIVAPHIASATVSGRNLMATRAIQNLLAGLHGERLPYCVNEEVYG
jgi:glyoxylate reductase